MYNPNSPFVVQSNDQLEDSKINTVVMPYSSSFAFRTQVEFKEREHMFLVSTNPLQDSIGKDCMFFNRADYMSVGQDMLQTWTCGHILSHNIIHSHYFGNLIFSSCCVGSTSSKIDVEDGFSSRKGG